MTELEAMTTSAGQPRLLAAGRARLLALNRQVDERGVLVPLAFTDVGFPVVRAFAITAADGTLRGGHAHRRSRQLLLRVRGVIRVELRGAAGVDLVDLDEATPALLIEPGVWAQQTYLGDDAALVVFSDSAYDPDDYRHEPHDAREPGA
jgi:dTDP-4-dehydrorhamnose 3,5-epimerase-like enzyme